MVGPCRYLADLAIGIRSDRLGVQLIALPFTAGLRSGAVLSPQVLGLSICRYGAEPARKPGTARR